MHILLALSLITTFLSSWGSSENCSMVNLYSEWTNASDHTVLDDPFHIPEGLFSNGSGRFTWSLDTQTMGTWPRTDNYWITQTLSLNTDAQPEIFSQKKYVGCGIVIHGIAYDKVMNGQKDLSTDCEGFISNECREGVLKEVEFRANNSYTNVDGSFDAEHVCNELADLYHGKELGCKTDFGKDAWIEPFVWAQSKGNQSCNSTEPYIVHRWGDTEYNSTNLVAYNNLTTLIEPIVATFLKPHDDNNNDGWGKSHMMCLRTGKNAVNGSTPAPSEVPRPSSASGMKASVGLLFLTLVAGIALAVI